MIAKVLDTKKGSGKTYNGDFDDEASAKSNLTCIYTNSNLTYSTYTLFTFIHIVHPCIRIAHTCAFMHAYIRTTYIHTYNTYIHTIATYIYPYGVPSKQLKGVDLHHAIEINKIAKDAVKTFMKKFAQVPTNHYMSCMYVCMYCMYLTVYMPVCMISSLCMYTCNHT